MAAAHAKPLCDTNELAAVDGEAVSSGGGTPGDGGGGTAAGEEQGERDEDAGRTRRLTLDMSLISTKEVGEETGSTAGAASTEVANPRDWPAPAPPRPGGGSDGSRGGAAMAQALIVVIWVLVAGEARTAVVGVVAVVRATLTKVAISEVARAADVPRRTSRAKLRPACYTLASGVPAAMASPSAQGAAFPRGHRRRSR